ncbi:hypothetical protein OF83DRAFT_1107784, partial [Amylostereum chailletii]
MQRAVWFLVRPLCVASVRIRFVVSSQVVFWLETLSSASSSDVGIHCENSTPVLPRRPGASHECTNVESKCRPSLLLVNRGCLKAGRTRRDAVTLSQR